MIQSDGNSIKIKTLREIPFLDDEFLLFLFYTRCFQLFSFRICKQSLQTFNGKQKKEKRKIIKNFPSLFVIIIKFISSIKSSSFSYPKSVI